MFFEITVEPMSMDVNGPWSLCLASPLDNKFELHFSVLIVFRCLDVFNSILCHAFGLPVVGKIMSM